MIVTGYKVLHRGIVFNLEIGSIYKISYKSDMEKLKTIECRLLDILHNVLVIDSSSLYVSRIDEIRLINVQRIEVWNTEADKYELVIAI